MEQLWHRVRTTALSRIPPEFCYGKRTISYAAHSYEEALEKLNLIVSNRQVTTLFDSPSLSSPSTPPTNLNAQAIPSMLASLRQAGYYPSDLSSIRHIHVAGTKGKGSVCAFATSLLVHHKRGSPVGTYTSPHLVSPRERIAVDGRPVDKQIFAEAVFEIWSRFTEFGKRELGMSSEEAEGPASKPFYFRFMTILAWHIFLKLGVRDVVMECGIGGEYDATNIIPREAVSAAIITQLGIDHVAMLGDTVEQIAWHKAGILKKGVRGFTRRLDAQPAVMRVLRQRAEEKGAELVEVDDALISSWGGVEGRLKGDYQAQNQALAVLAVRHHLGLSSDPSASLLDLPQTMVHSLREAHVRGRGELINDSGIKWYLDGAHTKESLATVAQWISRTVRPGQKCTLLFNTMDRDTSGLLKSFIQAIGRNDVFEHAIFTRNDLAKADNGIGRDVDIQLRAAEELEQIAAGCDTRVYDNIGDSVAEAKRLARESGATVVVTGSLHLVGGVLQTLEPGKMS